MQVVLCQGDEDGPGGEQLRPGTVIWNNNGLEHPHLAILRIFIERMKNVNTFGKDGAGL
jgi:hypothetical protein